MITFKTYKKNYSNNDFKIKARTLFLIFFLSSLRLFSQQISGVWVGSAMNWEANVCDIEVVASVSDIENGASLSFSQEFIGCNTLNTYASNNIINSPSLGVLIRHGTIGTGTGILTFSFSKQVHNPILHIDKIGGTSADGSNSVLLTLVDPDLSLTRLSSNDVHFEVTPNSITRTPGIPTIGSECGTPNTGTAAGSVQINGVFSEVSFQFQLNGTNGTGDLMEFVWESLSCDFDDDEVFDADDLDDDNDGILDTVELNGNPLLDTDGDGMIDSMDLDSDGDGCLDVIEAGFNDPEVDGILGSLPDDVDDDGLIEDEPDGYTTPLDTDANGIPQFQENERQQIVVQPESVYTTCKEDDVTLTVSILNPKNIQWQMSRDSGDTWMDLDNDTIFSGVNTEVLELLNVPVSFDGYLFQVKDMFCNEPILSEIAALRVLKIPDTGIDSDKLFCINESAEDLFNILGGNPDLGGVWRPLLTSGSGIFDPAIDLPGIYSYTIDNGFCDVSVSNVTVSIVMVDTQPEANYTICEQDNLQIPIAVSDVFDVEWQMSTNLGVTWTDLENDTVFSGVNSDNLVLFNVPLSFNGYWFRASDQFCGTPVLTEITELSVLRIPDPGLDGDKIFCVGDAPEDLLLSLGGNPDTNGVWTPVLASGSGVFDPAIDNEGTYTYTIDNGFCPQLSTVNVLFSEAPLSVTVDVVDNSYSNSITINAEGIGDYEYAIDGINYQDSHVFGNLKPDVYTIYVRDKNGCGGVFELEVPVLGYPKYFTPNGDGFNDIWNVRGVGNTSFTIYIYDRYGKLLKSYKEAYPGWDGTFNNQNMPATDYWFDFVTSEGRIIKGHFALKR